MPSLESERRTPDELRTLYELQPQVRDVIVEGRRDRDFIKWYLKEIGARDAQVYAVDDRVNIDSGSVLAASAETGVRGRVIALAAEASNWGIESQCLTCVIDADRNCIEPVETLSPCLFLTDVGSADVYLFQEGPMERLLRLVLGSQESAARVIEDLSGPLVELFLVRAALHAVDVALVDSFVACCSVRGGGVVEVDQEELARRSLARVGRGAEITEVLGRIELYRSRIPENRLQAIRGHDIAPLLIWRLGLRNEWAKATVIEASWRGCLRHDDLEEFCLFSVLRARVQA